MPCLLALDQGTTSSRAILFDQEGRQRGVAQKEFRQIYPQPAWVEHDPNEIWASQISVATEVLSAHGVSASDVSAIGITNQRETTLLWDRRTGQPVANAIVWQDRRTAPLCEEVRAQGLESTVRAKTGLVVDAYFSGTKVRWLLDTVPGARARAERGELAFGTVDSWLVWKLTGGRLHVTDVSNASRTLLWNIHTQEWDEELLSVFRVPAAVLPEVRGSSEVYGETSTEFFARPVPIAGIAGDQQAALFGQLCTAPGLVKNTYGTGCFLLQNTGAQARPSEHQLITTAAWRIGAEPMEYALEGSIFIAGAVVQWLRDGLKLIRSSEDVEALAQSVPDNGGVYLVPAFAGLGAPHWDPYARGIVAGITRGTEAGHFARAALEGIAYQVADVVDAMTADSGLAPGELRVDGGASANNLLMQFQADILNVPIVRPAVTETTALGAAFLAGLAVGYWPGKEALADLWQAERRFEPKMAESERARLREGWRRAVERAKGLAGQS